jgi:PhoH-like ATPase
MTKRYMIDTNIFFISPECVEQLRDTNNEIFIPATVLDELDNYKTDKGVNGMNIRHSIKNLESYDFINYTANYSDIPLDMNINDNKIIASAKDNNCILITNDISMRVKCKLVGVEAQSYLHIQPVELKNIRTGKHYINDDELLAQFYQKEELPKTQEMFENDFVLFGVKNDVKEIAQIKNGKICKLKLKNIRPSGIKFKNLDQKLVANHLYNKNLEIVSITGTMGVGKNFISLSCALDLQESGVYNKIFICKPPLALNKDFQLGFRPSTFQEKVMPTLSSFTSNLGNLSSGIGAVNGVNILSDYITFNKIEIVDLENIQGMSLPPKSILILDEFQLIEAANDGRAILSRIGEDSLVICLGDLRQMASQKHSIEESALYHLINNFSGYEKYAHIVMEEVVRSGFVAELDRRW